MRKSYTLSRYFGNGAGWLRSYPGSSSILVDWNGTSDGYATILPATGTRKTPRYERHGVVRQSLAELMRAIVAEHTKGGE